MRLRTGDVQGFRERRAAFCDQIAIASMGFWEFWETSNARARACKHLRLSASPHLRLSRLLSATPQARC